MILRKQRENMMLSVLRIFMFMIRTENFDTGEDSMTAGKMKARSLQEIWRKPLSYYWTTRKLIFLRYLQWVVRSNGKAVKQLININL